LKLNNLHIGIIAAVTLLTVLLFFVRTKPNLELARQEASVETQIDSAIAMVNGGSPMEGIFLLRDLSEEHPGNMRIQLNLGMFAVQSGQLDKAETRFNTVLEDNPNQAEALYFMGYIESQKGNNTKAVEYLEKALENASDENLKSEIQQFINELK
tara:strand:+ start:163 stop:627 length:465 start_codon:yes stop_codon:yes gene_type:complete